MFDFVGDGDLKELNIRLEEYHDREEAVELCAKGVWIQTECWAFALPVNDSADREFPSERAEILFGSAIADHVAELESVSTFEECLYAIDILNLVKVSKQ